MTTINTPTHPNLAPLLHPNTTAIIGASRTPDVISGLPQRILAQHRYSGAVYPVNPRYDTIDGIPCYPDIAAVPGPVDVAMIVVNATRVPAVLDACGAAGVRFAVVISSGFAEQADAAERQAELRSVCADHPGMRVLGPNSEGLINVTDSVPLGFSPTINYQRGLTRLLRGDVAVVAQSGGLGFALFNDGLARGLGFSHVVSTGNEVDLDLADVAGYLLAEPGTRTLMLFIEGLTPPGKLRTLATTAQARHKTLVVAKVGTSPAGRRAAQAHTGHDASGEDTYARIVEETGILRARDQEHMVDLAMALSRTTTPAGPRVGIVTASGGAGTWLADDLTDTGLDVPVLSGPLQQRLRELIPAYGSPANPVDATAQTLTRGRVGPVLRLLAHSGEIDALALVTPLTDTRQLDGEKDRLATLAAAIPLVVYSYTRPTQDSIDLLGQLGIAYYTSSRRTARALRSLVAPSVRAARAPHP